MLKRAKRASTRRKRGTAKKRLTSTVVRSSLPRTLDQDDFDATWGDGHYPASDYARKYET